MVVFVEDLLHCLEYRFEAHCRSSLTVCTDGDHIGQPIIAKLSGHLQKRDRNKFDVVSFDFLWIDQG